MTSHNLRFAVPILSISTQSYLNVSCMCVGVATTVVGSWALYRHYQHHKLLCTGTLSPNSNALPPSSSKDNSSKDNATASASDTKLDDGLSPSPSVSTSNVNHHQVHFFSVHYVAKFLRNVTKRIGEQFTNKQHLLDIAAQSKDATTIVFSRETWFKELCACMENQHKIAGFTLKCPLTIRIDDDGVCHSMLLNAFAEYDIRFDQLCNTPSPTNTSNQIEIQKSIENILQTQYFHNATNRIRCTLTCEMSESEDLMQLLGLPLANQTAIDIASQLLIPNRWDFTTEHDLCQFVYAQNVHVKRNSSNTMTPDRLICMMCDVNKDEKKDAESNPEPASFDYHHQLLVAVLCDFQNINPNLTTENVHDNTNEHMKRYHESINRLAEENHGKCVMYDSACCLIVPKSYAMHVNGQVHQLQVEHRVDVIIQTYIMQVQNCASIQQHTPRLTHVAMIEVV